MRKVAVIGLGYGDEGKGVVTQYLCSSLRDPIVVRFSGGHQCGHTVHYKDQKHMFSNFGSGTLLGVPTYWSSYCTFEPIGFWTEFCILKDKGINPIIHIHPECPVTTPYDVHANLHSEDMEHGSCGVGFWKTLDRHNNKKVQFSFNSLFDQDMGKKLEKIQHYYKNGKQYTGMFRTCVTNIRKLLNKNVFISTDIPEHENTIFEGSQGILLDQHHGDFPYVTPSNTTPENIIEMGHELDEIYMVTRSYLTRHGNGPIKSPDLQFGAVCSPDEANVSGGHQGTFRRAVLNTDLLTYAIRCGILPYCSNKTILNLVVTCVDQLKIFEVYEKGKIKSFANYSDFLDHLFGVFDVDFMYTNTSCYSDTMSLKKKCLGVSDAKTN